MEGSPVRRHRNGVSGALEPCDAFGWLVARRDSRDDITFECYGVCRFGNIDLGFGCPQAERIRARQLVYRHEPGEQDRTQTTFFDGVPEGKTVAPAEGRAQEVRVALLGRSRDTNERPGSRLSSVETASAR